MPSAQNVAKEFARRARKRARQLRDSFELIVDRRDSEAVHEFRKATRHLQTIVDACGVNGKRKRARKLKRQLQNMRHALSDWRDSDVLVIELKKIRKAAHFRAERPCWQTLGSRTDKNHRRAIKIFLKQRKRFDVKRTALNIEAAAKKEYRSEHVIEDLRSLLDKSWRDWLTSIDDFAASQTVLALHRVRIKAKSLRCALELMLKLYPDNELEGDLTWLKAIQDRVGAWHDELTLGRTALKTFAKIPRDPSVLNVIRRIKDKEIRLAEATRELILSIRNDADYKRLRRRLSASVFAIRDGRGPANNTDQGLVGILN